MATVSHSKTEWTVALSLPSALFFFLLFLLFHSFDKLKVNKIAARWPAKAVAQLFTFSKKGSDRIVPR